MNDGINISAKSILSLGYDFSMRPDEAMAARAKSLSHHIQSNVYSPLGIKDTIQERAMSLAIALRWYGIDAFVVNIAPQNRRRAEVLGLLSRHDIYENVLLDGSDGFLYLGENRSMMVVSDDRDKWKTELNSYGEKPRPDNTWKHGQKDLSMGLAKRVVEGLRRLSGDVVARAVISGRTKCLPNKIAFRKHRHTKTLTHSATVWAQRLYSSGYGIYGDSRVSERLGIGRDYKGIGASVTWDKYERAIFSSSNEEYTVSCSGSIEAVAKASLTRKPILFAVPRLKLTDDEVDAVLVGESSEEVSASMRNLTTTTVRPDCRSIPKAKVIVVCDDSQQAADTALSALLSGVIPVVPANQHTCLWAIPNIIGRVGNPEEVGGMAAELCAVDSKVFNAWRQRGTEGWGNIFSV